MIIASHTNSILNSVSYHRCGFLIDPGDEWFGFNNVSSIFLTHCHFDHIYGLNRVFELNPRVKIYTNTHGAKMLLDSKLNMSIYHESPFIFDHSENVVIVDDGETIIVGEITCQAIFTPGHNPSCISWLTNNYIFTGDAYIPGCKVITNLPGGCKRESELSVKKILELKNDRTLCAGHKLTK